MKNLDLEKIKNYIREKGCKHLFILISIQLILLIISCIVFLMMEYQIDENSLKSEDLYKWLILILFSFSQFYYAWHSIIKKNILELIAYQIISTCTTIASTLRYFYISTNDELNHKILVQIICYFYIMFSIVVQIIGYVSYKYFLEAFREQIFRTIGASVREQNKFKWFTSFECLLEVYAQLTVLIFVTFFFFFDLSDKKNQEFTFAFRYLGYPCYIRGVYYWINRTQVKKRILWLVYIYFVIAFLICIAENVKLFLFMNYYDFNLKKVHLDWATFTIITIIFISSIFVLCLNFYYGCKCIQLKLKDIRTFDVDTKTRDHFLSQYDY